MLFCGMPVHFHPKNGYQLDLTTPGISPLSASCRKQSRQMPNLRRYARGRPHSLQRLCLRLENFGFRLSFTRFAVVAILSPSNPCYASLLNFFVALKPFPAQSSV